MGAVNYNTSDYITLGVNMNYYDEDNKNYDYEINRLYDSVNQLLNDYDFYYYHVTIEPGYYEGFSIDIENNFSICYDDYTDKKEAQKEITKLKHFLLKCVDIGLVVCYPGWITGYLNYEESISEIKQTICNMREYVKATPTYNYYIKCLYF